MPDSYISFYLKANRVHVFIDVLRGLGSPSRICFMIEENGRTLLIAPYEKRDFKSHAVPPEAYKGAGGLEVSSMRLCQIIAQLHHWDADRSYRVPGTISPDKEAAIFRLAEAEGIERTDQDLGGNVSP